MSKFILVHDAKRSASPVIINSELITLVKESTLLKGVSCIVLNDTDTDIAVEVTETREQIFEMLK